jgi:hypothetical protein
MARKRPSAEMITLADHLRSISSSGGKARAELPAETLSKIGRKGGKKGGKARAAKLTATQRKKIASMAAKARWADKRKEKGTK